MQRKLCALVEWARFSEWKTAANLVRRYSSQQAKQEATLSEQLCCKLCASHAQHIAQPCNERSPSFRFFQNLFLVHRPTREPLHSKLSPPGQLCRQRRRYLRRELGVLLYIICAALRAHCCADSQQRVETVLISRVHRSSFSFQSPLFLLRRLVRQLAGPLAVWDQSEAKRNAFFSARGAGSGKSSSDRDCGPFF